jgi:hypothetical protein
MNTIVFGPVPYWVKWTLPPSTVAAGARSGRSRRLAIAKINERMGVS